MKKLKIFLEMIKFSHTVFALPFALTGGVLAANGIPAVSTLGWILAAMVGARTAAMGMNRVIDAEIDARNPRTSGRAIPAGLLGRGTVIIYTLLATGLMLLAAYRLNPLCLYLSPVALFFLFLYSYCKRFTSLAHLILGICLAAAPIGAWIAVTGSIGLPAVLLGVAVVFWVAGFDVLYALQDLEFDRNEGLHSIPAKFGVGGSLMVARLFHVIMIGCLAALPFTAPLGWVYVLGVGISVLMLGYEHWLLRGGDLTKLDAAFFSMNGYISVGLFIFTCTDIMWGGR